MHRFYAAEETASAGTRVTLPAEDARHAAQVLRLRAGDEAEIFAGGARYLARAEEISAQRAAFNQLCRIGAVVCGHLGHGIVSDCHFFFLLH